MLRTITFQPSNVTEVCTDVLIREDTLLEDAETFSAEVTSTDGRVLIGLSSASITITDNDGEHFTITSRP